MPYDPAAEFNTRVDAVLAKRDPRACRIAIRNVERMIASLKHAPAGLHVTHLIDGMARLEVAAVALERKVAA
jgi:hypothetical protein